MTHYSIPTDEEILAHVRACLEEERARRIIAESLLVDLCEDLPSPQTRETERYIPFQWKDLPGLWTWWCAYRRR